MPLIQFLTKIENYISWSIVAEFPETGEWDEWEGGERNYNNYDAVSLDSKSAFAPSYNFIFDDNGIEDSILDACLDYNSNEPVADEEKIYENYDATSLDSKSAFAPSCNFIFNADEVDVSVSLDDITGEREVTRSVRNFSDCDSDNNLPQSEEIVRNDLVIFFCYNGVRVVSFNTYLTAFMWLPLKTASYQWGHFINSLYSVPLPNSV